MPQFCFSVFLPCKTQANISAALIALSRICICTYQTGENLYKSRHLCQASYLSAGAFPLPKRRLCPWAGKVTVYTRCGKMGNAEGEEKLQAEDKGLWLTGISLLPWSEGKTEILMKIQFWVQRGLHLYRLVCSSPQLVCSAGKRSCPMTFNIKYNIFKRSRGLVRPGLCHGRTDFIPRNGLHEGNCAMDSVCRGDTSPWRKG